MIWGNGNIRPGCRLELLTRAHTRRLEDGVLACALPIERLRHGATSC